MSQLEMIPQSPQMYLGVIVDIHSDILRLNLLSVLVPSLLALLPVILPFNLVASTIYTLGDLFALHLDKGETEGWFVPGEVDELVGEIVLVFGLLVFVEELEDLDIIGYCLF